MLGLPHAIASRLHKSGCRQPYLTDDVTNALLAPPAVFLRLHGFISADACTGKARNLVPTHSHRQNIGGQYRTPVSTGTQRDSFDIYDEGRCRDDSPQHPCSPVCLSAGRRSFLLRGTVVVATGCIPSPSRHIADCRGRGRRRVLREPASLANVEMGILGSCWLPFWHRVSLTGGEVEQRITAWRSGRRTLHRPPGYTGR